MQSFKTSYNIIILQYGFFIHIDFSHIKAALAKLAKAAPFTIHLLLNEIPVYTKY